MHGYGLAAWCGEDLCSILRLCWTTAQLLRSVKARSSLYNVPGLVLASQPREALSRALSLGVEAARDSSLGDVLTVLPAQ
jgi:hypothetical protein